MKVSIKKWNGKINSFYIFIFFLTIPFLKPGLFDYIECLDYVFNVWSIVAFLIAAWYALRRKCINKIYFVIVVMEVYVVMVTLLKNASTYEAMINAFHILGLGIVCCLMVINVSEFIKAQLLCYEILIYANLIIIIVCPSGTLYTGLFSTHNYFLGYYNTFGKWFYPAAMIALLYMYLNKSKLRCSILFLAMWLSDLLTRTGGGWVAVTAMIIVLLIGTNRRHIFNYWTYWGGQIVFYFCVIQWKAYKYVLLAVTYLKKGTSFILRVNLWEWTLKKIRNSFLLGYGYWSGELRAKMSGARWQVHAHNLILDILFVGGIIYLILFTVIVIMVGKQINKQTNKQLKYLVAIPFLGWSIQSTVEPFVTCALISMFIIAYNIKADKIFSSGNISDF